LVAALLCGAALVAGCGGDDDKGPKAPKPAETIEQFRARLTTAVAAMLSDQCDAVDVFNSKAGFQLPCDANAKKLFQGFQVTGAKAYGTGGVVEFKDAEVKDAIGAYTVAIGEDGKYQITGPISPILPKTSLRDEPRDQDKMDDAAEEMVGAIRANDCNRFYDWVITPEGMEKAEACKQELTTAYGPLRQALTKDKDAKPERLEGNDRFMFYALQTGDEYRTLIVGRTAPGAPKLFLGFVTFKGPAAEKKT
jgi:hypothetical protein